MSTSTGSIHLVLLVFTCIVTTVDRCDGQATPSEVTVQLPTFHVFGVSTTVVVPDRGSIYLGGVNRSLRDQNAFDVPFGIGFDNRGIGRASSAGGVSVSATIIDHDAIDRAVLAEAARRRGAKFDVLGRPVSDRLLQPPRLQSLRTPSAASNNMAIESQRAATYLRRGRQAEADGQPHAAKIFYQRAAKHGSAELKRLATDRLMQIENAIDSEPTGVR